MNSPLMVSASTAASEVRATRQVLSQLAAAAEQRATVSLAPCDSFPWSSFLVSQP